MLGTRGSQPKSSIERLSADLRPDFEPNLRLPRHRWFRFKEGFSSSLVRSLLFEAQRQPGLVLDPFCGSGTTLLEASRWAWTAHGVEVNPFMAFVAQLKTEPHFQAWRLRDIAQGVVAERPSEILWRIPRDTTLVERTGLKKWFFNRPVVQLYERYRAILGDTRRGRHKRLVLLCLVAAMSHVANARRDGKCWRYRKGWRLRNYCGADLEAAFLREIEKCIEDVEGRPPLPGTVVVSRGDARQIGGLSDLPEGLFDALITSPPYLNSFDYTDIYRPELLLLGFGRTSADLRELRFETLRSHVQVDWPEPRQSEIELVRKYARKVTRSASWDRKRLGRMVNAYFVDLEDTIAQCIPRVRPRGLFAFVIARSAYGGVVIPVDEILCEILVRAGLSVEGRVTLRETLGNGNHQRQSNRKLAEVLIVARSPR